MPSVPPTRPPWLRRVWTATTLLGVVAAVGWWVVDTARPAHLGDASTGAFLALAVAFGLSEVAVIHVRIGRETYSLSLSEAPLLLGLLLVEPLHLVAAHVLGVLPILLVHRRQPAVKVGFNLVQIAVQILVATAIFDALVDPAAPLAPTSWPAAFGATSGAILTNVALITIAISLVQGTPQTAALGQVAGSGLAMAVVNTSLALSLAVAVEASRPAALLFAAPFVAVALAYRAYSSERRRRDDVEFLLELTATAGIDRPLEDALVDALQRIAGRFGVDRVEVLLAGPGADRGRYLLDDEGDGPVLVRSALDDELDRELTELRPTIVRPGGRRHLPPGLLDPAAEAIVVPLGTGAAALGALTLTEPQGDVERFTPTDLAVATAIGNLLATAVENLALERSVEELAVREERLHEQAYSDPLTGLANRNAFTEALAARLAEGPAGVAFVDLDDFKPVNDRWGHEAGDEVLREIARRFATTAPPGWLTCRLGGDEFALVGPPEGLESLAAALVGVAGRPIQLGATTVRVGASVGIATRDDEDAEELLRRADLAMYEAKQAGKGGWRRHDPVSAEDAGRQLRNALADDRVELQLQPISAVDDRRIVGFEALVRLRTASGTLLGPGELLGRTIDESLLVELADLVVGRVADELADLGGSAFCTINLSAIELGDSSLPERIRLQLSGRRLEPGRLLVEVPEGDIDDPTLDRLAELGRLGIGLAVSRVETGIGLLRSIEATPALVKLDRSTTRAPGTAVRAIVGAAGALGVPVVAEGVETEAQLHLMRSIGCEMVQGFHVGRPMPTREARDLLAEQRSDARRDVAPSPRSV